MKQSRLLFQLAVSTPHTDEIESSLWHTPSQQEPGVRVERLVTKEGQPAKKGERAYDQDTGRLAQVGLTQQVKMWPTPTAAESIDVPREVTWKANSPRIASNQGVDGQAKITDIVGGQLNPMWVEGLMGFPFGYTDIAEED